jgi:hypothetical protein
MVYGIGESRVGIELAGESTERGANPSQSVRAVIMG